MGNTLKGEKIDATKTVDAAYFKAVIFSTEDGISYKATPVKIEQHYTYAVSNDPHAPVELIAHVTINGKETTFVAAQVEAIELAYIVDYDAPSQNLPLEGATGKCPRCGAEDRYHCNASHTGPCVNEAVKPRNPHRKLFGKENTIKIATTNITATAPLS